MRGNADPKGYYRLLGVPHSASAKQIRDAFRMQAKKTHPDQAGWTNGDDRFLELREAYDVLRDARRRLSYDSQKSSNKRSFDLDAIAVMGAAVARYARSLGIKLWLALRSPSAGPILAGLLAVALVALAYVSGQSRSVSERLAESEKASSEYQDRLAVIQSQKQDIEARYHAANFMALEKALANESLSSANSRFIHNRTVVVDYDKPTQDLQSNADLDRVIVELASAIIKIPADREWIILVEGQAGGINAPKTSWERTTSSLNAVVDYFVRQGLPADRLAIRMHAGLSDETKTTDNGDIIEVKLLCCFR